MSRVIYIRNPRDGGSHFRTIGDNGGRAPRTSSRPPRARTNPTSSGDDRIMDIIGQWIRSGGDNHWTFMENGPGIEGTAGGPVTLTGGAIYNTAPSNWALYQPEQIGPDGTPLSGPGIRLDTDITIQEFMPAQTVWGYLYLVLQDIDPVTGETGISGPGHLADPLSLDLAHQLIDNGTVANLIQSGAVPPTFNPSFVGYTTERPPSTRTYKPRPWWAQ